LGFVAVVDLDFLAFGCAVLFDVGFALAFGAGATFGLVATCGAAD
jgi:hypothetical protein